MGQRCILSMVVLRITQATSIRMFNMKEVLHKGSQGVGINDLIRCVFGTMQIHLETRIVGLVGFNFCKSPKCQL